MYSNNDVIMRTVGGGFKMGIFGCTYFIDGPIPEQNLTKEMGLGRALPIVTLEGHNYYSA